AGSDAPQDGEGEEGLRLRGQRDARVRGARRRRARGRPEGAAPLGQARLRGRPRADVWLHRRGRQAGPELLSCAEDDRLKPRRAGRMAAVCYRAQPCTHPNEGDPECPAPGLPAPSSSLSPRSPPRPPPPPPHPTTPAPPTPLSP